MTFRPLSRRDRPDARFDRPQPGLPDYLLAPVISWIDPLVWNDDVYQRRPDERVLRTMQLALRMQPPLDWGGGAETAIQSLYERFARDRDFALDALDFLALLASMWAFSV